MPDRGEAERPDTCCGLNLGSVIVRVSRESRSNGVIAANAAVVPPRFAHHGALVWEEFASFFEFFDTGSR